MDYSFKADACSNLSVLLTHSIFPRLDRCDGFLYSENSPLLQNLGVRHAKPPCIGYESFPLENLAVGEPGPGPSPKSTRGQPWPSVVWFLLKIIGLYNYRRIVTRRPCHLCHLAAVKRRLQRAGGEKADTGRCGLYPGAAMPMNLGEDGNDDGDDCKEEQLVCLVEGNMNTVFDKDGPGSPADEVCAVCRSEWWDGWGRCRPYSETDIGVRKWNHCGSAVLSLIWPLTLIGLIMYDFCNYLHDYWGHEEQLIRLISYSTFLSFNLSSPLMSLVANIQNMMVDHRWSSRRRGFSWYECLSVRFIVKRLQHLGLGEQGLVYKPYLTVCIVWPVVNGVYRAFIYYIFVVRKSMNSHMQISLATGAVSMVVWGSFCYLMLLMRLSFQKQQRLELSFLWRHAGQVDVCRGRLALYAQDLGSMCRLVSAWVIMVVAVSTWAFTTQISRDYLAISSDLKLKNANLVVNINIMIWSENFMFLILPLVALGGFDLNKTWVQFVRNVSQMRSEAQEVFWDKLLVFCEEQSPVYRVETTDL
ncbi:uncharacterized protein LOC119721589, partial [Patiria miniata]|uniref:Uncharacterized protein n=1 Tax=Patiria miniata TaxID=46514 RepID=A0A913Z9A7_PATMI